MPRFYKPFVKSSNKLFNKLKDKFMLKKIKGSLRQHIDRVLYLSKNKDLLTDNELNQLIKQEVKLAYLRGKVNGVIELNNTLKASK